MGSIEKGNKKIIRSWMMYDWANSAYNLVITTAIFPIFYEGITKASTENGIAKIEKIGGNEQVIVNFFGGEYINTALISYVGAVGFLLVALLSPLLSGVADFIGRKKMFLRAFAYLGSFSCIALYWFDVNNLELSLTFYLTALIGFWGSLVYYNAYLPEIAEKKDHDRISAGGFSLGYIGSTLLLAVCLVLIQVFNRSASESFLLTGIWWFLFSHIFFFSFKESKSKSKKTAKVLLNGFRELKKVWKELNKNTILKRYLSAFFVYSMGVQTVMLVAVYFAAKEIHWSSDAEKSSGLIISMLLIQLVAVGGAMIMSAISKRIGNIATLKLVVLFWVFIVIWAYFIITPIEFYVTAVLVGLVMGGIQSLSRSTYSKFLPETDDTSSYFSFYDATEKIGIVIGMFMFAFLEDVTGSMRNSVLVVAVFFVIGYILLSIIPKETK